MSDVEKRPGPLSRAWRFITTQAAGATVVLVLGVIVGTVVYMWEDTLAPVVCRGGASKVLCETFGYDQEAETREALLAGIEGRWGNVGDVDTPSCRTVLIYETRREGDDDIITVSGEGWSSTGHVEAVDGNVVITRTITPVAEAGTQWTLRVERRQIVQIDHVGVPTPLVRCDG